MPTVAKTDDKGTDGSRVLAVWFCRQQQMKVRSLYRGLTVGRDLRGLEDEEKEGDRKERNEAW